MSRPRVRTPMGQYRSTRAGLPPALAGEGLELARSVRKEGFSRHDHWTRRLRMSPEYLEAAALQASRRASSL
jgi:hypothetical protein